MANRMHKKSVFPKIAATQRQDKTHVRKQKHTARGNVHTHRDQISDGSAQAKQREETKEKNQGGGVEKAHGNKSNKREGK